METQSLTFEHMMYLHGMCSAKSSVMMSEILQNEDPEMACLDLQCKTIADHCLFLAIAREYVNSDNIQDVAGKYARVDFYNFTRYGRGAQGDGAVALSEFVGNVLMPARQFLNNFPDASTPDEYIPFLDKIISVYS